VVGSINVDFVIKTDKFPTLGETVLGNELTILYGGKGANQAVQLARLNTKTIFFGVVGDDSYGVEYLDHLKKEGVDVSNIRHIENVESGIAQITLLDEDNRIIIVKGANDKVSKQIIDESRLVIEEADLVLLQLEIPLETVEYVVDICHRKGIKTVLWRSRN